MQVFALLISYFESHVFFLRCTSTFSEASTVLQMDCQTAKSHYIFIYLQGLMYVVFLYLGCSLHK